MTFSAIPENWVATDVQDVFHIVGGGTPSTAVPEYWSGSVPWITSADIDEDHHVTPHRFVTEDAISNSATNKVPSGSVIVVTRVGLGKVGIAPSDICFSQDSQALIFNQSLLDSQYVLFFMSQAASSLVPMGALCSMFRDAEGVQYIRGGLIRRINEVAGGRSTPQTVVSGQPMTRRIKSTISYRMTTRLQR